MKLNELTQDQQRKLVEFRAGHVDGKLISLTWRGQSGRVSK